MSTAIDRWFEMTYCLAIKLDEGMVFASDSLTNAGVDQISTYPKLHTFSWVNQRNFALLSSGNLATTQAVIKRLRSDSHSDDHFSLFTAPNMDAAAEYVGRVSYEIQRANGIFDTSNIGFEATFIFGGQIGGDDPALFLIYPQGNFIHESPDFPFLQIGETKYGKPILDRIIRHDTPVELAARCALVSINSTIRSNLTVGPPIELQLYWRDHLDGGRHVVLKESDPLYKQINDAWYCGLKNALNNLPGLDWGASESTDQQLANDVAPF